jgi:DNA-binding NarL/FixJ family response regulator
MIEAVMSRSRPDADLLPETAALSAPGCRPKSNILSPLVALLAHADEKAAAHFREVFEDVACDWRLVRVPDGTAATRHVVNKGLPDLLVLGPDLPQVGGPELVEWMRSFRGACPIPILVCGDPADAEARERFIRLEVRQMVPASAPRPVLAAQLAELVAQVENRRFALPA